MTNTTVYILALLAIWLISEAHAHSHLANPRPTRQLDCRAGNGRPRDCFGPCPRLNTYGKPTGVSPSRPAEVWKRGQTRIITWHRNNHGKGESGFVRFTLVPIDKMMDKAAHKRFTFQISCWDSGLHRCYSRSNEVCGNDAEGKAYKVPIQVPSAYPDGVYVFGWAWYGGGDYRGRSFFGDYYSCSFIRIKGGVSVTSTTKPVFVPGIDSRYKDACMASTNRVGVCVREPCRGSGVRKLNAADLPRTIFQRDLGGSSKSIPSAPSNAPRPRNRRRNPRPNLQSLPQFKRGGTINIKGMEVIDLRTMRSKSKNGKVIRVKNSDYRKGFTLALKVSGSVEKVHFNMLGSSQTEYLPPFIVNGNVGGSYRRVQCRRGKAVTIKCTVFGPGNVRKRATYKLRCN